MLMARAMKLKADCNEVPLSARKTVDGALTWSGSGGAQCATRLRSFVVCGLAQRTRREYP
jgi:hypothetical protein